QESLPRMATLAVLLALCWAGQFHPRHLSAAEPATPQEAASVLDLRSFVKIKGAEPPQLNTLGTLMYEAPGDATSAFDFQRNKLLAAGWIEQPGGYHAAENHSGQFAKSGYLLSVSTSAASGDEKKQG